MKHDAYDFLLNFQHVQLGIMADEILDLGFGSLTFSATDTSAYFNNVLVNGSLTDEQLSSVEKIWQERIRSSTFYFENSPQLAELKTYLTSKDYQQAFEDCWMFHPGTDIDSSRFAEVREVQNQTDLEVFISTFDQSFQADDPQNPYGTIGEGLNIARRAWIHFQGTHKLQYFIAYQNGQPVAVSALTNHQGHGYISNVGSLRSVRGQGFGKLVSLFAVDQSVKNGNSLHYLGTEEGHYPHEFYSRIGFETKYKMVGWSKVTKKGT